MQTNSSYFASPQFLSYQDQIFLLNINRAKCKTLIYMQLLIPEVNTRAIPTVYTVLKKLLPSVLVSKCFNEENLPFAQEVKQTEIGHLFEHILLEYLCQGRLSLGNSTAIYSGSTSWNWQKDPRGTFHISITSGIKDSQIFEDALIKTIQLTKFLIKGIRIKKDITSTFHTTPISFKNGIAAS